MTFIKIQNVVINISYVAVVRLDNQTVSGEKSVSVTLATPQFSSFQWDTIAENILDFGFWIFLVRPTLLVGETNLKDALRLAITNLKLQI
ncbi:hypothetical protein [Nostoc sp.]